MTDYENIARAELAVWQRKMKQSPSFFNSMSKSLQVRINKVIPEKVHRVITAAIEHMTRAVLSGAAFTTSQPLHDADLEAREERVRKKIYVYRNTAAAEGAVTGAAGILVGLSDFPLWLTLKMKMLSDIAALYGYSADDYKERIYILHIFQITFSSQAGRQKIYPVMENWEAEKEKLPATIDEYDWRSFQQEYRDYIDLAKLLQLVPGIGAVVGGVVNHRLTQKLGDYAMQAYRLRLITT